MNMPIAFKVISDLSFHRQATQNHPNAPVKERSVSMKLDPPEALIDIAAIKSKEDSHLTYHDKLSLGVVLLNRILYYLVLLLKIYEVAPALPYLPLLFFQ